MKTYIGAREAMCIAGSYALGGVKVPHSISNPVIRRLDDGKYAIALFVYTFNREQIQSGKANRPLEWSSVPALYACGISEVQKWDDG